MYTFFYQAPAPPLPSHIHPFYPHALIHTTTQVMRAPEGSPYKGAVFELSILFPPEYPALAPVIRFVDPIVHPNVNANGKICHRCGMGTWPDDV